MSAVEFDKLAFAYLAGGIGEQDLLTLDSWLQQDDGARARFAYLARQEIDLRDVLLGMGVQTTVVPRRGQLIRWLAPMAAAAAFLIAVGLFVVHSRGPERAPAVAQAEIVTISAGDGCWVFGVGGEKKTPVAGTILAAGEKVEVGKRGSLTLGWRGESTRVRVLEEAGFSVQVSGNGGKAIHLETGKLEATVAKQAPGRPMIISTPHAETTVLGTRLKVDTQKAETRVHVDEGAVEVRSLLSEVRQKVTSRQTLFIDAGSKNVSVLGEVLLEETFENGLSDWTISMGTVSNMILAASEKVKAAVCVKDIMCDGKPVKCMVIDGGQVPGTSIDVSHNRIFTAQDLVCETEYMVSGRRREGSVNLGIVVRTPWDVEPLEEKNLLKHPLFLSMSRWSTQRGEYWVTHDVQGRRIVNSASIADGKVWYRHRTMYKPGVKTPLMLHAETQNLTLNVRRMTVRRLLKRHDVAAKKP